MRIQTLFLSLMMLFAIQSFSQEIGKVSYYSHRLVGRKMTNGERYNAKDFVAAHRDYPLGTVLKVSNLDNGKFVIVRVTDRGPFHRSRVIDISYAAAEKIGLTSTGYAQVKVEEANDLRFLLKPETILTEKTPKLHLRFANPISLD